MWKSTRVSSLQEPLQHQLQGLTEALKHPFHSAAAGVLLMGSCSRGEATYRSDIDLLLILSADKSGPLNFTLTRNARDSLEQSVSTHGNEDLMHQPLEVQVTVVLDSVFETREPVMRNALSKAILLQDYTGQIHHRLARLAKEVA